MTQQPELAAKAQEVAGRFLIDPGNIMVNEYPTTIVFGPSPDGSARLIMTIRCGNATLSLPIGKSDVIRLARQMADEASKLPNESGLYVSRTLPIQNGQVP
jgi:hypothetical protein